MAIQKPVLLLLIIICTVVVIANQCGKRAGEYCIKFNETMEQNSGMH